MQVQQKIEKKTYAEDKWVTKGLVTPNKYILQRIYVPPYLVHNWIDALMYANHWQHYAKSNSKEKNSSKN
jgi:hypothetical protein